MAGMPAGGPSVVDPERGRQIQITRVSPGGSGQSGAHQQDPKTPSVSSGCPSRGRYQKVRHDANQPQVIAIVRRERMRGLIPEHYYRGNGGRYTQRPNCNHELRV